MTGISDYVRMSTFYVRRSKQFKERLEPTSTFCILYRSIEASIVDFVLVFTFHYKTTAKAQCIFKAKENVEPENQHAEEDGLHEDGEAEEVKGLKLNEYPEKMKVFGVFWHLLFRFSPSFF